MDQERAHEIVRELGFAELQILVEACTERMDDLRASGVLSLAEKFEQMAAAELGMTAKKLMTEARRQRRKLGQLSGDDSDDEDEEETTVAAE